MSAAFKLKRDYSPFDFGIDFATYTARLEIIIK